MGKRKEYTYKNKMNKRIFSVNVTVLFIVSMLLVALAPITVAALSKADKADTDKADKEYIEIFNEYYEIIRKDVEEAEAAYHTGKPEIYKEKIDKVVEDANDATRTLSSYSMGTSKQIYVRVATELYEASSKFWSAQMQAKYEGLGAYTYDPESSFEKLKEGMEHLEKAKSLLPESKVPGFSAILAIAGLLAMTYLLRRRG